MIVVAAIQTSGGRGKKAPPSLARRHRLGRWAWRNSRWQGRRWSFCIPFSEEFSAIGAAKHSALAYATNHHERGGQEQSGSRDLHPSPFTFLSEPIRTKVLVLRLAKPRPSVKKEPRRRQRALRNVKLRARQAAAGTVPCHVSGCLTTRRPSRTIRAPREHNRRRRKPR